MAVRRYLFIRHAKTAGNIERRYIGRTDEPLCEEGVAEAEALRKSGLLPPIDTLISGTAKRCRQTAELLFPDVSYALCPLTEIDFGIFEGKSADDLLGDSDYEKWLEAYCMGDIPGGDGVSGFKQRCCEAFGRIAGEGVTSDARVAGGACVAGGARGFHTTALVLHGGNIMAILERLAYPQQGFYEHHLPNCGFLLCRYENGRLYTEQQGSAACSS